MGSTQKSKGSQDTKPKQAKKTPAKVIAVPPAGDLERNAHPATR